MSQDRFFHHKHGWGKIIQTRYNGLEIYVEFENGYKQWYKVIDNSGDTSFYSPPQKIVRVISDYQSGPQFRQRHMIEAFRLGIVPYDAVEDFTFGRDKEIKRINEWLSSNNESTLFIVGEYGTGKTHLLHYTISHALRTGYAVAWVELDPNESPFHKPKRVYQQLAKNFQYLTFDGEIKGFRDFVKTVVDKGGFSDHVYFSFVRKFQNGYPSHLDELWSWLEAAEPKSFKPFFEHRKGPRLVFPGLYDFSKAANIYCYLLSSLGWAAKSKLGLKGLVLVFDEAEIVSLSNSIHQDSMARNFLKALIRTANDDQDLEGDPLEAGLSYCIMGEGHKIPFLYKKPSGLKLLFAFTSLDWNYMTFYQQSYQQGRWVWHAVKQPIDEEFTNIPTINLSPLSKQTLRRIVEKICGIYMDAYSQSNEILADKVLKKIPLDRKSPRLFVKSVVEALDLLRFYPDQET